MIESAALWLAGLVLISQSAGSGPLPEPGTQTAAALMSGCVPAVAQRIPLSEQLAGSGFERVERPAGLPVGDGEFAVWKAPYKGARIFVSAPEGDTSECYVSVYDAQVSDVAPVIRALLSTPDSPFVEGKTERVGDTGAVSIIYTSRLPSRPLVLNLIANSGAEASIPSVQLALKWVQ